MLPARNAFKETEVTASLHQEEKPLVPLGQVSLCKVVHLYLAQGMSV